MHLITVLTDCVVDRQIRDCYKRILCCHVLRGIKVESAKGELSTQSTTTTLTSTVSIANDVARKTVGNSVTNRTPEKVSFGDTKAIVNHNNTAATEKVKPNTRANIGNIEEAGNNTRKVDHEHKPNNAGEPVHTDLY